MVFLFIIEKQTLLASSQLGHQKVSKTNANCVNFPLQKRKLSASWKSHNALTAQHSIQFCFWINICSLGNNLAKEQETDTFELVVQFQICNFLMPLETQN